VRRVLEYLEDPSPSSPLKVDRHSQGPPQTPYSKQIVDKKETGAISKRRAISTQKTSTDIDQTEDPKMSQNFNALNKLSASLGVSDTGVQTQELIDSLLKTSTAPAKSPVAKNEAEKVKDTPVKSADNAAEMSRDEVMAQRKAKKEAKQAKKSGIKLGKN